MGATKACPFCAEQIAAEAMKCKHCGQWLDGRADDQARQAEFVWAGDLITVQEGVSLASARCLICGGTDGVARWNKRLIYTPPWVYIGLLGGVIPAAILSAIFTKRATIELSRCAPCRSKMITRSIIGWLVGLGGFVGFPVLGALIGKSMAPDGTGAGIVFGFLAWLVALIVILIVLSFSSIRCRLIESGQITLKFPNPEITRSALVQK